MINRHSPVAEAACHDLLRALLGDAVSHIRGAPIRVERNERVYWYDSYRIATSLEKRCIGKMGSSVTGDWRGAKRRKRAPTSSK